MSKNANKPLITENPNISENRIENYSPMVFHLVIIVIILISCFTPGILSAEKIGILVADGIFQFVSTVLIVIIGLINPFVSFSPETRLKIEQLASVPKGEWLNWFLKNRNWQLIKALFCILIVAYFIYNKYLVIPNFNQGTISSIAIILILFFVFGNIIQLIKNPVLFKQKTIFRMSMLFRSFKLSFFISIGLILVIFITSALLKLNIDKMVNVQGIVLLVYNVVMAYNEYKILNA
ncbi:hypothetical protein EZ449_20510 [Pedobacter frigidisoli]|uniref:Uncharacterized protein n=1 Tax=Pedobacter frigidisoli TaxID=2530455 RepID=A0A4R0NIW9_9SPHI|nr:hypothetical protein [Pedobacter frigidisoli]TCD00630.1 hypothetical protein EZ449_20510 [Pedobacter frigidisoli]